MNTNLFKTKTAEAVMRTRVCVLVGGIVLLALTVAPVSETNAEWAVSFQNRPVGVCQSGVTVDLTVSWDVPLTSLTIPVIVRGIDAGSFWMDPLPVDTAGGSTIGVTWNWSNPGWANIIQEFRPGVPAAPCATAGDVGYDGVSPDHFVINASGVASSTPAEPDGRVILTFSFDVTGTPGDFEFDTACFSAGLPGIFMIDDQIPPVNHGPLGTGEASFTKGIITILPTECPWPIGEYPLQLVVGLATEDLSNTWNGSTYNDLDGDYARFFLNSGPGEVDFITGEWTWTPGCDDYGEYHVEIEVSDEDHANCGQWACAMNILGFDVTVGPGCCFCADPFGDLNCDGELNPQDVILLVWEVYKNQCGFCYPDGWYCPNPMADVDCSGNVNPVDVVYYVNRVFKGLDVFCPPCPE